MPGIRIRAADEALANKTVEIEHHSRRTAAGPKTYRLRLDDTAAVIVSETVWARLQEAMAALPACPRFYALETIARPPTQGINGQTEDGQVVRYSLPAGRVVDLGVLNHPKITLN